MNTEELKTLLKKRCVEIAACMLRGTLLLILCDEKQAEDIKGKLDTLSQMVEMYMFVIKKIEEGKVQLNGDRMKVELDEDEIPPIPDSMVKADTLIGSFSLN